MVDKTSIAKAKIGTLMLKNVYQVSQDHVSHFVDLLGGLPNPA